MELRTQKKGSDIENVLNLKIIADREVSNLTRAPPQLSHSSHKTLPQVTCESKISSLKFKISSIKYQSTMKISWDQINDNLMKINETQ